MRRGCTMLLVAVLSCLSMVVSQRLARVNVVRPGVGGAANFPLTWEGYDLFDRPTNGFANWQNNWPASLAPPVQLPASQRIMHFFWDPSALGTINSGQHPQFAGVGNGRQSFTFEFTNPQNANILNSPRTVRVKLEAPLMEVSPDGCANAVIAQARSCRCNVAATRYEPDTEIEIVPTINVGNGGQNVATYTVPTWTYFPHAPLAGQNPYLRTHRRVCLWRPNAPPIENAPQPVDREINGFWFDTTLYFAVEHSCVEGLASQEQLDPNSLYRCNFASQAGANGNGNQLWIGLTNGQPRLGLTTEERGFLGVFLDNGGNTANNQQITDAMNNNIEVFGESEEMRDHRLEQRSVCCGAAEANLIQGIPAQWGLCIDPTISDCCGRRPYLKFEEKCCSRRASRVSWQDQPCPCLTTNIIAVNTVDENMDCNVQGANDLVTNAATDRIGFLQPLTNTYACCAVTKYPTYSDVVRYGTIFPQAGFCHLKTPTTAEPWRCCDDGNVFDPAAYQCCPINGIQTLNLPCPCTEDAHCPDGNQKCCIQWFPPVFPPEVGPNHCNSFANYPMAGAPLNVDPQIAEETFLHHSVRGFPYNGPVPWTNEWVQSYCPGQCYRSQFQICCNGRICIDEYERCCNDTCCNKFTSTCTEGQRPGTIGSRSNSLNYDVWYEVCSQKENLTSRRAFMIFALPIILLFGTLLALAIAIVLARRATEHTFDLTERVIVAVAALSVLIAAMFFFSPNWRYGLFIAFIDIIIIMIVVLRKRRFSLLAVILLFLKILLLLDPFAGNLFLSFTGGVPHFSDGPEQDPVNIVGRRDLSSSLFDATQRLWRNHEECVDYYDYFMFDAAVRDFERHDNPRVPTFGYCSRAWITTLMIMAILLYALQFLLLLLALFALAKKWGRRPSELIQLEVIQENAPMVIG